jgi:hypothetical protein
VSQKPTNAKPGPLTTVRKDGSIARSYGPARDYSRAPFRSANMANLRHGAYSVRVVDEVAAVVGEEWFKALRSRQVKLPNGTEPG